MSACAPRVDVPQRSVWTLRKLSGGHRCRSRRWKGDRAPRLGSARKRQSEHAFASSSVTGRSVEVPACRGCATAALLKLQKDGEVCYW